MKGIRVIDLAFAVIRTDLVSYGRIGVVIRSLFEVACIFLAARRLARGFGNCALEKVTGHAPGRFIGQLRRVH
jgi:hypothetical protein